MVNFEAMTSSTHSFAYSTVQKIFRRKFTEIQNSISSLFFIRFTLNFHCSFRFFLTLAIGLINFKPGPDFSFNFTRARKAIGRCPRPIAAIQWTSCAQVNYRANGRSFRLPMKTPDQSISHCRRVPDIIDQSILDS